MKKIICKDHTLSGESFELQFDSELDMYSTYPPPSETELPKYYKSETYISHTDSKKTLFDKIYQEVKKYSVGKKVALLESFKTSENKLLDVGCGTGDFLKIATNKSWEVRGVEPNKQAREHAAKKLVNSNIIVSNIDDLLNDEQTMPFDVITLWHVLEHIPNYDSYIENLKFLLKKDGYLVVAVPNFKSDDAHYYKEFWAAFDVPRHLWHFSQKSIHKIFDKHQMQVTKILPMRFDSYYVSLLSEKYKTGTSNIISALWRGFMSNWKAGKTTEYSSLIFIVKNKQN